MKHKCDHCQNGSYIEDLEEEIKRLELLRTTDYHRITDLEKENEELRHYVSTARVLMSESITRIKEQELELLKAKEIIETLKHNNMPNECVNGWIGSDLKFCDIRNGEGGKCYWCTNLNKK